jgi:hypothetical protein
MQNLQAIHVDWAYTKRWIGGYRVFWNFSRAYVDTNRCRHSGKTIKWQVEGSELLSEAAMRRQGILIVTAHMGNYDLAAQYFTDKLSKTMHVVRAPERMEQMQSMRCQHKDAHVITHYNLNDSSLGPRLARLLMDGELVAVQADRVVGDVSPMCIEVEQGLYMQIPRGPWVLSCLKGVSCIQATVTRIGYYEYRIFMKTMPQNETIERSLAQQLWGRNGMFLNQFLSVFPPVTRYRHCHEILCHTVDSRRAHAHCGIDRSSPYHARVDCRWPLFSSLCMGTGERWALGSQRLLVRLSSGDWCDPSATTVRGSAAHL